MNKKFSEAILAVVQRDDVLWINDYHLLLLPQMLSSQLAEHHIGFFLHIRFPDPSIFDHLRFRDDLLEEILSSDQVGVYTDKYKSRLPDCIDAYVMRRNATPALPGNTRRATRIGVFPLGVDALRIRELLGNAEARALVSALRTIFAGRKIILSADRLDYTKGIPQKLHGYDKLLGRYPEFRERVQLADCGTLQNAHCRLCSIE